MDAGAAPQQSGKKLIVYSLVLFGRQPQDLTATQQNLLWRNTGYHHCHLGRDGIGTSSSLAAKSASKRAPRRVAG